MTAACARSSRAISSYCLLGAALLLGGGCDDQSAQSAAPTIRVQLDWVPEPEHGGIFAAEQLGLFKAAGLSVEIIKGAPGVPVAQMVASGTCEVGVLSGDQVLTTRSRGGDVVAVYATFETNPTAVMVHESSPVKSLADLWTSGGTLATEPGLPWINLMDAKYGKGKVQIVATTGGLALFKANPDLAQSIFITAEPVQLKLQNVAVRAFSVAESGYNPYVSAYCVSGSYLREQRVELLKFLAALQAGWAAYQAEPSRFNPGIAALNPAMTVEAMNLAALVQHNYVGGDESKVHGLGWMSPKRWEETEKILRDTGLLAAPVEWQRAFANLLPQPQQ
ncbi:MAG: ABC transporter substrate-binding protein [Phycisphaerales bacterium]|nr:ABC transporter substrate-binding protein [Phycisphaerales bacterium]